MNLIDYAFKEPKKLSHNALADLEEINSVMDFSKKADLFKRWIEKYKVEDAQNRADKAQNISNFVFLVNYYLDQKPANEAEVLNCIHQYRRHPGFYVWQENGQWHFKCKYHEAMTFIQHKLAA